MATIDRAIPIEDGPWDAMLDSKAPTSRKEGALILLQNAYPLDPTLGDGVVGRPGVRQLCAQFGTAGRRRIQGIYQFTKKNGTEYSIVVAGGYFYTIDWVGEVATEVVTNANLTTASITLSQTAQVAFQTYDDKVHVSDGVNIPFLWDGTAGAGGLTKLTASPALYGQPTTYQGRIFGIKASDLVTMVWSEADSANTGYESGGFTNAWTITQTDPNRLYRLVGKNDGLLVIRARSATIAGGSVSTAFESEATREGISDTQGTTSPFAVVLSGTNLIVLDADYHPQMLRAGAAGFTPIWTSLRETIKKIPKTPAVAAKCMAVDYLPASLLLIAVPDIDATECNMLLVYDTKSGEPSPVAVWRGWEMTALAMTKTAVVASLGTPTLLHGDSSGYVYLHGNPEDSLWNDALATGTVPIEHILECQALGYSVKREKIFDRIDIAVRALSQMTLSVSAITPRGQSIAQSIVVDSGIAGWDNTNWDEMTWDVDVSLTTQEAHGDVGIDLQARWVKPRIEHAVLDEQFGIVALTVLAYPTDDDPGVP